MPTHPSTGPASRPVESRHRTHMLIPTVGHSQTPPGLDIPHLYMEQIIAHIHTILRYGAHHDDPMGYLLHVSGEAMRLEIGYGGQLLDAPFA